MPIIMVVDVGKFELPDDLVPQLRSHAARVYDSLKGGDESRLPEEEYGALFSFLHENAKRITLVDPRAVDIVLPSPTADFDLLRRVFTGRV